MMRCMVCFLRMIPRLRYSLVERERRRALRETFEISGSLRDHDMGTRYKNGDFQKSTRLLFPVTSTHSCILYIRSHHVLPITTTGKHLGEISVAIQHLLLGHIEFLASVIPNCMMWLPSSNKSTIKDRYSVVFDG